MNIVARSLTVLACSACGRPCAETFELRDPQTLVARKVGECHALIEAVRLLQAQYARAALVLAKSMGCVSEMPEIDATDALLAISAICARFEHGLYLYRRNT